MNELDLQEKIPDAFDLKLKGYTIASAARAIHRSKPHVWMVVNRKRISNSVVVALNNLPRLSRRKKKKPLAK